MLCKNSIFFVICVNYFENDLYYLLLDPSSTKVPTRTDFSIEKQHAQSAIKGDDKHKNITRKENTYTHTPL